jgi:lipooligosaccharide transport system permease protein
MTIRDWQTKPRQGSLKLINPERIAKLGSFSVTQARLQNMRKFFWVIAFEALANPMLYLISVGIGIGALVDANLGDQGVGGVSYITFIAPALLAATAINGAMDEVVFPSLDGFKWQKTYFAMNSTPLTPPQIAFGVFFAAVIRTVFAVTCYWILLYLFGALDSPTAWLAIPTAIFAGAGFGAIMLALVSQMDNEDLFLTVINRLVIMPLFLFSGTFYPLENMPIFLQPIGWVSPLWHATELGRYLTYDYALTPAMVAIHFLVLTALLLIGLSWAFKNFTRRLAK